jgi:oligogalacturonide lyase
MNTLSSKILAAASFLIAGLAARAADAPAAPVAPSEWIDAATGHVLVRLSQEAPTASMYFHQNGYTPDGKKLLIFTPKGMSTVDLQTHAIDLLVPGFRALSMSTSNGIEVSRKEPVVYYNQNLNGQNVVIAMNMETHEWKQAAVLPAGATLGGISADDKTIMGIRNVSGGKQIYTVDIKTGETKSFFPSDDGLSHDNLNHFECSPTDPNLMLFAHEGDWTAVDRIWTMHADGTGLKLMHQRTMPREIAGHEFFSRDGKWVYYDLQTPESGVFWLGGANVETGEHIRYPLQRVEWSVHYYVSWDGKKFLGDGGGPDSVANRAPNSNTPFDPPQNGQWMYLFTPTGEYTTMDVNGEKVKVGKLTTEKLVDMSKHDYGHGESSRVEPNATFTPDDKWIVFRSNMEGALNVYEVEVAKATPEETKRITAEWAAYNAAAGKPADAKPAASAGP